jgi:hypothetical protein
MKGKERQPLSNTVTVGVKFPIQLLRGCIHTKTETHKMKTQGSTVSNRKRKRTT